MPVVQVSRLHPEDIAPLLLLGLRDAPVPMPVSSRLHGRQLLPAMLWWSRMMTLEDAIALIKEKGRRSIQCDCPDCQAQKVLLAAYEQVHSEAAAALLHVHGEAEAALSHVRGQAEDALLHTLKDVHKLEDTLRRTEALFVHAEEVCPCPVCWRARHGGAPGPLTGKHMVLHVTEEAERLRNKEAELVRAAIDKAGLAGKTAVEAITILDAEESRLSALVREMEYKNER